MVRVLHIAPPYRCYAHDHGLDALPCGDVAAVGVVGMVCCTVEVAAAVQCTVEVVGGLVVATADMPVG